MVFSILTAGWSGVARSNETKPPITHDETDPNARRSCWPVFERLLHRHPLGQYGRGPDLTIQASSTAWKEGIWTSKTFHSELKPQPFDTQALVKLRREDYHSLDAHFDQFMSDCAEIARRTLDRFIEDGDLEYASMNFRNVDPTLPALEVVMRIGRAIESGHQPDHIICLMRPLKAPDHDRTEAIETPKQLDAKAQTNLIRTDSEWTPLNLEAMPDQKLAGSSIGRAGSGLPRCCFSGGDP